MLRFGDSGMNAWVCPVGKGLGLQEAGWAEGLSDSPMPNTSTDQQGLGQGGRPGGRGCLPPRLPAGGPGHRAGCVHVHGSPGDPGCLLGLPRPALAAPVALTVNQRLVVQSGRRQSREARWMWRWHHPEWDQTVQPSTLPGCHNVRLNIGHSCSQTCVNLWGAGGAGGA